MNIYNNFVAGNTDCGTGKKIIGSVLLLCALGAGCTVKPEEKMLPPVKPATVTMDDKMTTSTPLQTAIQFALADAARRSGLNSSELKVVSAERVTWSDGSMGCPAPDMGYTQALVDGYRIRIQAGKELLNYHGGTKPAFCPANRVVEPLPNDKI